MKMKNLIKTSKKWMFGAVAVAGLCMTSCNSSSHENGGFTGTIYMDYVTLASDTEQGSTFTMHKGANTPLITYVTNQRIETGMVKVGERCVLAYYYPDARPEYTSGTITIQAYQKCINGGITEGTAEDTNNFKSDHVQCSALWITGNYLNFSIKGLYGNSPKTFKLVADETTMDSTMPTVYLIYETDNQVAGAWKDIYASLDISKVWSSNKYEGFVLKMTNDNNIVGSSVTFKSRDSIQPVN